MTIASCTPPVIARQGPAESSHAVQPIVETVAPRITRVFHDLLEKSPELRAREHEKKAAFYKNLEKWAFIPFAICSGAAVLLPLLFAVQPIAFAAVAIDAAIALFAIYILNPNQRLHNHLSVVERNVARQFDNLAFLSQRETLQRLETLGIETISSSNQQNDLLIDPDLGSVQENLRLLQYACARLEYCKNASEEAEREATFRPLPTFFGTKKADEVRLLKVQAAFVHCLLRNPYMTQQVNNLVILSKGLVLKETWSRGRTTAIFLTLRNRERTTLNDYEIDAMSAAQLATKLETAIRA